MSTSTYTVAGMTCSHCVSSVSEEVSGLPGVTAVDVDLTTGKLDVISEAPISDNDVRTAVEEAGYALVGS